METVIGIIGLFILIVIVIELIRQSSSGLRHK
jgi:hypothetical protein